MLIQLVLMEQISGQGQLESATYRSWGENIWGRLVGCWKGALFGLDPELRKVRGQQRWTVDRWVGGRVEQ